MQEFDGHYQQNLLTSQRYCESTHEFEQRVSSSRLSGRITAIEEKLDKIIAFLEINKK